MFLENPKLDDLLSCLKQRNVQATDNVLLLVAEECEICLEKMVSALNKQNYNFAGGVFPKVVNNNRVSSTGIVLKAVSMDVFPVYFNTQEDFEEQFSDYQNHNFTTAFTLTDGISDSVSNHLRTLFTYLGNDVNFIGGGTGRLTTNKSKGILFDNDGIYNTGTLVIFMENPTKISASHGWKKSVGPFIVTKSKKNVIKELNWENAFDVYKKCLIETQNIQLNRENFNTHSIHYPFGIYKEERDYIVRDAIELTEEGCIRCVGSIPENSLVDLLTIQTKDISEIPDFLVKKCIINGKKTPEILIFDCISRAGHFGNDFHIELDGIHNQIQKVYPNGKLEGVLSIGEIFSNGEGYLELLNKSVVLGFSY